MGDSGSRPRDRRARSANGAGAEVVEAWRSPSGHALAMFLPERRRALLLPAQRLSGLASAEVATLLEGAASLTRTEAVFRATDGSLWLAQARGPVWASESSARGLCGTIFTRLEGAFERFESDSDLPWREEGDADSPTLQATWTAGRAGPERGDPDE